MRRPYHKTRTVATFNWNERAEMFAYINRMNALGIGHFSMGGLPTIDWNEEAILDELMQPRDETTGTYLSMPALFNCDERRTARTPSNDSGREDIVPLNAAAPGS